jgi:ABC-type antimicrobial peptide transport system permease subunit
VYLPTEEEQVRWGGSGLYLEQTYEPLVLATTTDPVHYRFIVVTGVQDDKYDAIQQAVVGGLTQAGQRYGDDATHRVFVTRTDTAGADVRSASEGVKLVYGIIGWGVLILGGLGLLVAELIVVRDRMWFLGLARAIGARARQVAGLIITDVLLVLLTGTALALLLATVVQPVANQFAHDAFGISVQLLHPGIVRQLAAGGLLVLVVAAGYPVWHALRQDPLDVLEPRAG